MAKILIADDRQLTQMEFKPQGRFLRLRLSFQLRDVFSLPA